MIRENKTAEAVTILTQAMNAYPFDAEVLGNLGYAQYLNQNYEKARDTLALALKLSPNRSVSWSNLAFSLAELFGDVEWATECLIRYYQNSSSKNKANQHLFYLTNSSSSSSNLKIAAIMQLSV